MPVFPRWARGWSGPGEIWPSSSARSIIARAARSLPSPWVVALELGVDADAGLRAQALQLDQRRMPDGRDDVAVLASAGTVVEAGLEHASESVVRPDGSRTGGDPPADPPTSRRWLDGAFALCADWVNSQPEASMLLLMWVGGCSLVALTFAALTRADGPWLLGFLAIIAAQVMVLAGRATRLPPRVTWPLAIACLGVCALGFSGTDLVILLGLAACSCWWWTASRPSRSGYPRSSSRTAPRVRALCAPPRSPPRTRSRAISPACGGRGRPSPSRASRRWPTRGSSRRLAWIARELLPACA